MEKQEIIAKYATKEGDTGSPEVQIALLTEFGVELVDHLVGVGLGDAQFLGHFLHAHKVLCLH